MLVKPRNSDYCHILKFRWDFILQMLSSFLWLCIHSPILNTKLYSWLLSLELTAVFFFFFNFFGHNNLFKIFIIYFINKKRLVRNIQPGRKRSKIVFAKVGSSPTNKVPQTVHIFHLKEKKDTLHENHGMRWKVV